MLRWYAARGQARRGAELSASLGWYWITRATTEGTQWLDEFLAGLGDGAPELGWAYFMRGFLALLKNDPDAARPALRTAMATASRTGQRELLPEASAMASVAKTARGDHDCAVQLIQTARAAVDGLGYPAGRLALLQAQALYGFAAGDLETVRAVAAEGAELARADGDLYALGMMTLNLGSAGLIAGDLDPAKPALVEALRVAREIDDRVSQAYLLVALAYHAAMSHQASLAARLLGAADEARAGSGITCCCSSRDWSRSPPNLPVPHWEHRDSRPGSLPDGS